MKQETVLIIDDSKFDLFIAKNILKEFSDIAEIICKNSAPKALDYLISKESEPQNLPNIILLDISMPEMDGFEFLKQYENLSATIKDTCKIFMLSSSLHSYDIERAKECPHVIDFIKKPFSKTSVETMNLALASLQNKPLNGEA